jgi:hypothetical protein
MEPRDDSYREQYESLPLEEGEIVSYAHLGARYASELKTVGGNLVLTNQRLLFEPLKTSGATGLLSTLFKTAKLAPIGDEIDALGRWPLLKPWSTRLAELASAEPIGDSDRVRVSLKSGESMVFRIAAGRWTPRFAKGKNIAARDQVLGQLRAAIAQSPGT